MNASTALPACILVLGSAIGYADSAIAACRPEVFDQGFEYPDRAVARGQEGTVLMDVLVTDTGRAAAADVVDSSGYRLLDQTAQHRALTQWRFDISSCERKDLPVKHRIAVEYRNEQ